LIVEPIELFPRDREDTIDDEARSGANDLETEALPARGLLLEDVTEAESGFGEAPYVEQEVSATGIDSGIEVAKKRSGGDEDKKPDEGSDTELPDDFVLY
jgi:hypothetical protein